MDDSHWRSTRTAEQSPSSDIESISQSLGEVVENIRRLRDQMIASMPPNQLSLPQINDLLESLPRLAEQDIIDLGHRDSLCPICLNPILAILAEEEMAIAMDSPAHPIEELGVTRLCQSWQCGHIFCRRDISKWIQEAHDSCPMCRRLLVKPSADADVHPTQSPDFDTLANLEQQINLHTEFLRTHIQRMPISLPDIYQTSPSSGDENEIDRSTFSGMYS